MLNVRPLPSAIGYGFTTDAAIPVEGYRYENVGRFHNYYFTADQLAWPYAVEYPAEYLAGQWTIDAFSPNLNKFLHVGHIRNLALGTSLQRLFPKAKFIAMLGEALGKIPEAEVTLKKWLDFVEYHPTSYTDLQVSAQVSLPFEAGEGDYTGSQVWVNPVTGRKVVIRRSDGSATYAYHDLALAQLFHPSHYLTGHEQKSHFESLGLSSKHLPMGLVCDPETRKKLKSRDGTALSAEDAKNLVIERLKETENPEKLAWNVLVWNMLRVARSKDVLFSPQEWTNPQSPGLYITYTLARILSALKGCQQTDCRPTQPIDFALHGMIAYFSYYLQRAVNQLDPSPIAGYAHELAKTLNDAYHQERIQNGRPEFIWAISVASNQLRFCVELLGMFPLVTV